MADCLARELLLWDSGFDDAFPRYTTDNDQTALIFDPHLGIIKHPALTSMEGFYLPLTTRDVDWDGILIQMLLIAEKDNKYPTELAEVEEKLLERKPVILSHPSNSVYGRGYQKVIRSELCPENITFGMPYPQFLGVYATGNPNFGCGLGVLRPEGIISVRLA